MEAVGTQCGETNLLNILNVRQRPEAEISRRIDSDVYFSGNFFMKHRGKVMLIYFQTIIIMLLAQALNSVNKIKTFNKDHTGQKKTTVSFN